MDSSSTLPFVGAKGVPVVFCLIQLRSVWSLMPSPSATLGMEAPSAVAMATDKNISHVTRAFAQLTAPPPELTPKDSSISCLTDKHRLSHIKHGLPSQALTTPLMYHM